MSLKKKKQHKKNTAASNISIDDVSNVSIETPDEDRVNAGCEQNRAVLRINLSCRYKRRQDMGPVFMLVIALPVCP